MAHPRLPSPHEALVLELLTDGREWYGLEILTGTRGKVSKGGLYVLLSRMEDKGYIKGRKEETSARELRRAPRRLFQITGQGQRSLAALELARINLVAVIP